MEPKSRKENRGREEKKVHHYAAVHTCLTTRKRTSSNFQCCCEMQLLVAGKCFTCRLKNTNVSYLLDVCGACTSHFLFLNNILYLLRD